MNKIESVRLFKNGGTSVRYASGIRREYSGKKTPKSVFEWIMEEDTIGHDGPFDILYTK